MSVDLVLTCVKYRTRFEAYQRIDAMDMERVRTILSDEYGDEEYDTMSENDLRQQVKNMADAIYSDTDGILPGTTRLDLDGKVFIFAGGFWDDRGDSPSEEYDTMRVLVECGIDHD